MRHRIIAALTALSLLSACAASPEHQAALADFQQRCSEGNKDACTSATYQENENKEEARQNGLRAAAVAVLLPLLAVAAVAANNNEEQDRPLCYSHWSHSYYRC